MMCSAVTCFRRFWEVRHDRTTLASWEGHVAGVQAIMQAKCHFEGQPLLLGWDYLSPA